MMPPVKRMYCHRVASTTRAGQCRACAINVGGSLTREFVHTFMKSRRMLSRAIWEVCA